MESQGWDNQRVELFLQNVLKDFETADLSPLDQAMLSYALKLTRYPSNVQSEDVKRLKKLGCNDLAIHDLCSIVSYFNFVNRIADGLGVELES